MAAVPTDMKAFRWSASVRAASNCSTPNLPACRPGAWRSSRLVRQWIKTKARNDPILQDEVAAPGSSALKSQRLDSPR